MNANEEAMLEYNQNRKKKSVRMIRLGFELCVVRLCGNFR